jgi:hypothetical protein
MNTMAVKDHGSGLTTCGVFCSGEPSLTNPVEYACLAVCWDGSRSTSLLPSCSPSSGYSLPSAATAEQLCDELLGHMLECGVCLGLEAPCPIQQRVQHQIAAHGGAQTGVVFAF